MQEYDVVMIGAGHNRLVCAAYLLKTGYRVLPEAIESQPTLKKRFRLLIMVESISYVLPWACSIGAPLT
jgi:hypothetical protein